MLCPNKIQNLLAHVFELEAEVHEDLGRHAFLLAQQAQQQVFRADVVVIEVARFLDGVFDDLLGPRRLRQLAHGRPCPGPLWTIFSTSRRILRRSMSRFLRTLAATPEPSLTRPSRMCSVPMYSWLKRCASWLASCITLRARSVKRSYI